MEGRTKKITFNLRNRTLNTSYIRQKYTNIINWRIAQIYVNPNHFGMWSRPSKCTKSNYVFNMQMRSYSRFCRNVMTTVPESSIHSHSSTSPPPFLLLEKWISSSYSSSWVSITGRLEMRTRLGHTSVSIWETDDKNRSLAVPLKKKNNHLFRDKSVPLFCHYCWSTEFYRRVKGSQVDAVCNNTAQMITYQTVGGA